MSLLEVPKASEEGSPRKGSVSNRSDGSKSEAVVTAEKVLSEYVEKLMSTSYREVGEEKQVIELLQTSVGRQAFGNILLQQRSASGAVQLSSAAGARS